MARHVSQRGADLVTFGSHLGNAAERERGRGWQRVTAALPLFSGRTSSPR